MNDEFPVDHCPFYGAKGSWHNAPRKVTRPLFKYMHMIFERDALKQPYRAEMRCRVKPRRPYLLRALCGG